MTPRHPDCYPCTCHRCAMVTATRIDYVDEAAQLTCTVCADVVSVPMARLEFGEFVLGVDRIAQHLAQRHPEIRRLYVAGRSFALPR